MNRAINFYKRNVKEIMRDPIIYIFCLGFPVVMFLLFFIINKYSNGNTPTFEIPSLLPGIMVFSYSFIMLTLGLMVSKDKGTFFLKRLYSSPMKAFDFIFGYFLVGFIVGLMQSIVCIVMALILSINATTEAIPVASLFLLVFSQLPILILNIFLGILFGTILSDKSAPGISSVFISVSGILGGCWMPLETMGGFETFCRVLPFYPAVYIGRVITKSVNALGVKYTFDSVAYLGLIPILVFTFAVILLTIFAFKKSMVSDN